MLLAAISPDWPPIRGAIKDIFLLQREKRKKERKKDSHTRFSKAFKHMLMVNYVSFQMYLMNLVILAWNL